MAKDPSSTRLQFEPPGPGSWEQDPVHFPRACTRYYQATYPQSFQQGSHDFAELYGLLIDGLLMNYVNGFAYKQVVPAPKEEVPSRFERADEVYAKKLWRDQLREWDEKCKPASVEKHRELLSVNPDTLSDNELAEYLKTCRDHHAAMISQHMRFTAGAIIPIGDFLGHVGEWTTMPHSELIGLLRGSAEVSKGGSDELTRLKIAFTKDDVARAILESNEDEAQILARLRQLQGDTGQALADYLDFVGYRIMDGFDICEPTALEMPKALVAALRVTLLEKEEEAINLDKRTREVREKVPSEHKKMFDELLNEARLMYRLRDERGVFSDVWAAGIMRRAALSAGRRCARRGVIFAPEHLIDADLDEMCALVLRTGGPSADELAERAQFRATLSAKDVPATLGPEASTPPDFSKLPPHAARIMRATFIALDHVFGSAKGKAKEEKILYGLAASQGIYEGPARRIGGPSEFNRIQKGDVLITESTTEAFNILLPLLGGVVTDNGGLLSHAAIVSREYGIPGVVGTSDATVRIADGVKVRVDGNNGEVTVLE